MRGPKKDYKYNCCSWTLFMVIHLSYFVIIAPYSLEISIFSAIFGLISFILFLLCQFSDPGIIPRAPLLRLLNNGRVPEKFRNPLGNDEIMDSDNQSKSMNSK